MRRHYECFIVNNRNNRSKIVQLLKQGRIFWCEYMDVCVAVKSGLRYARDPRGGGHPCYVFRGGSGLF